MGDELSGAKKQMRPNKAQIRVLLEYMREHPNFAARRFSGPNGPAQLERQWETLASLLNESGPVRDVRQWKVTWRDQKSKARREGTPNCALRETGNGPKLEPSDNSVLILDPIGIEMAVGIGPPETGVGAPTSSSAHSSSGVSSIPSSAGVKVPSSVPSSSRSQPTQSRKRKAAQSHLDFLGAQRDLNRILETHLPIISSSLASINSTLQIISEAFTGVRQRQDEPNSTAHSDEYYDFEETD